MTKLIEQIINSQKWIMVFHRHLIEHLVVDAQDNVTILLPEEEVWCTPGS